MRQSIAARYPDRGTRGWLYTHTVKMASSPHKLRSTTRGSVTRRRGAGCDEGGCPAWGRVSGPSCPGTQQGSTAAASGFGRAAAEVSLGHSGL